MWHGGDMETSLDKQLIHSASILLAGASTPSHNPSQAGKLQ